MVMRAVVGLFIIVTALGACTGSPGPPEHENASSLAAAAASSAGATSNGSKEFGPASPVPDVRIAFTVYASAPQYPGCCKLVVENTGTRTLYGVPCHLVVFDRDGHVLYRGPVDPPPQGIGAPPGRSADWGFIYIPVRHPDQIATSHGECQAWDWGPNGPPP
jgi:hypothetical protein